MTLEQYILLACAALLVWVLYQVVAHRQNMEVMAGIKSFHHDRLLRTIAVRDTTLRSWASFTMCQCKNNGVRDVDQHRNDCRYVRFIGAIGTGSKKMIRESPESDMWRKFNDALWRIATGK